MKDTDDLIKKIQPFLWADVEHSFSFMVAHQSDVIFLLMFRNFSTGLYAEPIHEERIPVAAESDGGAGGKD